MEFRSWRGVSVLPRTRPVLETGLRKLAPAAGKVEYGLNEKCVTGTGAKPRGLSKEANKNPAGADAGGVQRSKAGLAKQTMNSPRAPCANYLGRSNG